MVPELGLIGPNSARADTARRYLGLRPPHGRPDAARQARGRYR
ncbi:hypothetical protein KCH_65890 [Kitasatospora cheerisanensis KCTC 2395]|uniref:Uncharacterized protein n=1 Tax=Kitasatospora cheerisanensis KCTC 2395 TaxID=1348663 RepID=A0A066YKF5_9ACTN|nr:hypothetical protein KCH_65890 [Kitasatospora cheerisanensis KCTC 2395]